MDPNDGEGKVAAVQAAEVARKATESKANEEADRKAREEAELMAKAAADCRVREEEAKVEAEKKSRPQQMVPEQRLDGRELELELEGRY